MALTILPRNNAAGALGSALGTGLSAGISGLLQNKIADIERSKGIQRTRQGLEALGAPAGLENLPENLQNLVVKDLLQRPQRQANVSALERLLGGGPAGENSGSAQGPSNLLGSQGGLSSQDFNNLARLGLQQRKTEQHQKQFETSHAFNIQKEINRNSAPYIKENLDKLEAAQKDLPNILRMQELNTEYSNAFPNPTLWNLAQKSGLDWESFLSPEALEFQKLGIQKLKGASKVFGGKVSNNEMAVYLKQIPNLMQTPEGRAVIIRNNEIENKVERLWGDAINSVIEANGGEIPKGLQQRVHKMVDPELDRLTHEFKQGFKIGNQAYKKANNQKSVLNDNSTMQLAPNTRKSPLEDIPLYGTQLSQAPEESAASNIIRNIGRAGTRALEGFAGRYSGIPSLALQGANVLGENVLGQGIPYHEEIQSALNPKSYTNLIGGESLQPRNEQEKRIDELAEDFGSFLGNPAQGIGKVLVGAATKAGIGNLASFLTKSLGGGEGAQTAAKIGSTLLATLFGGRKNLATQYKEGYKTAEELAHGENAIAKSLKTGTDQLKKEIEKGIDTPAKDFIRPLLKRITTKIKNNKIPVSEAVEIKKDLNDLLRDSATPEKAQPYLKRLVDLVKGGPISEFSKQNPEFGKEFNKAENIYRGLKQTSAVTRFLKKHVNAEKISNPIIKTLLLGGIYKLGGAPLAAAGIGTAYGAREVSQVIDLLKNSSEARKYYGNLLKAASKGQVAVIDRYVQKLDKVANEQSK